MAASDHVQPVCLREDALAIVHRLTQGGHLAYFAGGCVRDMLWNLTPKDYDVATNATPQRVRELFPRSQGVGQAFGVVLVRIGRSQIEVATFRADGSYSDGRRPDAVRFATPEEDAQRRDFTINGLFYDPLNDAVIDHVGGQADLQTRTLRSIGDPEHRFSEDYLRLLRAVRFAARFQLSIEPNTAQAIRHNAAKLPRIAAERICDELRATLVPPTRLNAKQLLDGFGLTDVVLRHVLAGRTPADPVPGSRPFAHLRESEPVPFALALTTFAVDALLDRGVPFTQIIGPASARHIGGELRRTFKLSNEDEAAVDAVLRLAPLLDQQARPTVATMKRFLAAPYADEAVEFLRACHAAGIESERIAWLESTFNAFAPDQIAPTPLLDGNDLQEMGHRPGPKFKVVLDQVYDAQLEGRVSSKEQAQAMAASLMGP